jgi:hypothetical protein
LGRSATKKKENIFVGKPHRSATNKQTGIEVPTKETKNMLIFLDHNTEQNCTVIFNVIKSRRKAQTLRNNDKKIILLAFMERWRNIKFKKMWLPFD